VLRSDPLGLARLRRVVGAAETVLVRPRVFEIPAPSRGAGARRASDDDTATRAPTADAGGEFFAVRPYELGDDPRGVHWRSSARFDDLVVRQFVAPRQGRTVVVLDTRAPGSRPPADEDSSDGRDPAFEHAVEATASIVTALGRSGRSVECVTTSGAVLAPAGCDTRRIMDRLAVVAMDEPDLLAALAARQLRRPMELVVLVTARNDAAMDDVHRRLAAKMPTVFVLTGGSSPQRFRSTVVDARTVAFPDAWATADTDRTTGAQRARRAPAAGQRRSSMSWTLAEPSLPPSPSPR
jgi:uncharacterized protein (DUF58 family)